MSNSSSSSSSFQLPPLYFQNKGRSFATTTSDGNLSLPAEVLHQCLTQYSTWGDMARLSCVQKGWKNTMYDAAKYTGPESQWELACAMMEGTHGLDVNVERALQLLHQIVSVGTFVNIDPQTEEPIYTIATTQENENDTMTTTTSSHNDTDAKDYAAMAMKKLALYYLEQPEGCRNKTGLAWLQCAFEAGNDIESAHDLALIYEYGRYSVPTDVVVAAQYFEKAAVAGHVNAMAELALCYELGCGVPPNDEIALDWYIKAATAGHVTAKYAVGEAFEEARGVPQSDAEACLWYYKAALDGDEDSRKALRRLEAIARIVVPGVRALLLLGE